MLRLRLGRPAGRTLRRAGIFLIVLAGIIWLYFWRLGHLTPGLSPTEAAARRFTLNFHELWSNPVNAPQRLLQYLVQAAGHHGAFWMRLPSALLAIIFLGLFYKLAKNWFGRVVGTLSTIILATTPWVILLARDATPGVLLLAPVAILSAYTWFVRAQDASRERAWLVLLAVCAVSLYVPGMVWLELAGALVARKELTAAKNLRLPVLVSGAALKLVLLMPLIWAAISHPSVLRGIALLPAHWPAAITAIKATAWALLALVWRTPYHVDIIIGRLPVLDITQIVLIVFGAYALWAKARRQLYVLAGVVLLGTIGSGLNQNLIYITLGLPALMVMMAAGLRYLYVEWRNVFPRNPIPRALAISLMVVLVALHVVLGVRYALVAWPHTLAVKHSYVIK